jgi:hypothetical protein
MKRNINELIASLLEAIAEEVNSQEKPKTQDKTIIKGISASYEELILRPDAQKQLINLHNLMFDKITELENRVAELEEENN